jgi:hypothetical protein
MNCIINIIICSIILPILSFKEIKPKICINCKYFITDYGTDEYGKCSLFPIINNNFDFLVNGIDRKSEVEYSYCCVARGSDSMCGEEGKFYKKI